MLVTSTHKSNLRVHNTQSTHRITQQTNVNLAAYKRKGRCGTNGVCDVTVAHWRPIKREGKCRHIEENDLAGVRHKSNGEVELVVCGVARHTLESDDSGRTLI